MIFNISIMHKERDIIELIFRNTLLFYRCPAAEYILVGRATKTRDQRVIHFFSSWGTIE
jgi:hypothetical protein